MNAMATPADRALATEVVNERIRRWKISQKLTEQSEAWAERRRVAMSRRAAQRISNSPKIYDSKTQKTAHSSRTGIR